MQQVILNKQFEEFGNITDLQVFIKSILGLHLRIKQSDGSAEGNRLPYDFLFLYLTYKVNKRSEGMHLRFHIVHALKLRSLVVKREIRGRKEEVRKATGGRERVVCPWPRSTYMQRGHDGRAARRPWHSTAMWISAIPLHSVCANTIQLHKCLCVPCEREPVCGFTVVSWSHWMVDQDIPLQCTFTDILSHSRGRERGRGRNKEYRRKKRKR